MKRLFGVLLAVAFIAGLSVPAMAAGTEGWSLWGQAGIFTEWTIEDEDRTGGDSRTDFNIKPWDTVRFGADYKGDKLSGSMTVILDDNAGSGDDTAYIDDLWGQVDFDALNIRLGHMNPLTFNPVGLPPGKYGNSGIGTTIGGTNKYVIDFIFPIAKGMRFEAALVQQGQRWAQEAGLNAKTTLPGVEVAFSAFTGFPWKVYAGFETYDVTGTVGATTYDEENKTAYIVGAVVRPSFGPVRINFNVNYSTNLYINQGSPWHFRPAFPPGPPSWNYALDDDTTRLGIAGSVGFAFSKMISLNVGGGYQKFELDDDEDPMMAYWINLPVQITPNFRVMPYYVMEDADTVTIGGTEYDQGVVQNIGVYWTVSF